MFDFKIRYLNHCLKFYLSAKTTLNELWLWNRREFSTNFKMILNILMLFYTMSSYEVVFLAWKNIVTPKYQSMLESI